MALFSVGANRYWWRCSREVASMKYGQGQEPGAILNKFTRGLLVATGSLFLLSIVVIGGFIAAIAVPGDSGPIERAAAALEPEPDWAVTQTDIQPPHLICVGDVACPSLLRIWNIPGQLTEVEFEALVRGSGWGFPITGACEANANVSGGQTLCEGRGFDGNFDITVSQEISSNRGIQVRLYVEASH